jgi:hypothetical protein
MKQLEYVYIDDEEMSWLICVSLHSCISKACKDEYHPAYNLLIAATFYFGNVQGFNPRVAIQMHNNYMYDRLYNLKDNGYPISNSEIKAIKSIKEKIQKISEKSGQNEIICFNLANSFIIDMIIHNKMTTIEYS